MRELFEGVSLPHFAAGNRRLIQAVKARTTTAEPDPCSHPEHKKNPTHAEHCPSNPAPKPEAPAEGAEHPFVTWAKRIGGTIGALILLWPIVGKWVPTAVGGALVLWVIAALIAGQADPSTEAAVDTAEEADEETDEETDDDAPEDDDDQADEEPEEEPRPTGPSPAQIHLLAASLTASGSSVLLTRLAADLGAAHPLWKGSTKAVRALLSEAGIPVREGVRTPDGNGPGVHHQDVPPLPSPTEPTPLPGVVANVGAGESANANTNNAGEWVGREGFVMRADPENPARTIIVSQTSAA